jgi:hypothetical protein
MPFLSDAVHRRRKQPLLGPPVMGNGPNPLLTLAQDMLRSSGVCAPFYDRPAVLALLDRASSDESRVDESADTSLLAVLSLSLLGKQFALGRPA